MRARVRFGCIGVIVFASIVALIVAGYHFNWYWTGFGPETSEPKQHAKTLWDWMQLLIIPIMLVIGGFWLNQIQKRREEQNAEQRSELEHELTHDNQRETLLQAYIDKTSELLLQAHLRTSLPEDEVRTIARVRTLIVLSRLDGTRKSNVLQFLYESGLIDKTNPIINLEGADFRDADMKFSLLLGADLKSVNFAGADLGGANLSGANLSDTDLRRSLLIGAKLSEADLTRAKLLIYIHSFPFDTFDRSKAWLIGADLRKANLSGAQLDGAQLGATYHVKSTSKSEFEAVLQLKRDFTKVLTLALKGADSTSENTTGIGPFFWESKIRFSEAANLSEANLSGATLIYANLSGVKLRGANLSGTNLRGANLNEADLTDAIVTREQLSEARSLLRTIMPDGSVHD